MYEQLNTPTPISQELTQLREIQALGQLLVGIGAFTTFLSLRKQIPLLAAQAQVVQRLQQRVQALENRTVYNVAEIPY